MRAVERFVRKQFLEQLRGQVLRLVDKARMSGTATVPQVPPA